MHSTSHPGLEEVKAEIDKRAAMIGASGHVLPTYGRSEQTARPHIELDERGYHYVVAERGNEWERITTRSLDELLYRVFQSVSFELAVKYEVKNRVPGQDFRRVMWARQLDLLNLLEPKWKMRRVREIEEILATNPYRDHVN